MSLALMATKEQKEFIWKRYSCLLKEEYYRSPIRNMSDYPNPYISFTFNRNGEVGQTRRTEKDDLSCIGIPNYSPYFIWISYKEFIKKLNEMYVLYHARTNRNLKF